MQVHDVIHRSRRARRAAVTAAVLLLGGLALAGAPADPAAAAEPPLGAFADALTTTGPAPPPGVLRVAGARDVVAAAGEVLLAGVPAYRWHDGCAPTSAGMLLGYYDAHGFPGLIEGDASTQTAAADQAIASHGSFADRRHYEDYALPLEGVSGSPILEDRSEAPAGDEHPDDSLADFMKTSRSSLGLAYGWSFTSYAGCAVQDYVAAVDPSVAVTYSDVSIYGTGAYKLSFASLQAEIDAGRPLVLFVDSSGDGVVDHAVLAFGYRETGGFPEYACRDTWSTGVRWSAFREPTAGVGFGVFAGTTFAFAPADPSADTGAPVTTVTGAAGGWSPTPVRLTFTATDHGSGVDRIEAGVDGEGLVPLAGVPATLEVAAKGVHTVTYRAVDKRGNAEPERVCTVRIDREAPLTSARAARVRHGARVSLRYRVDDVTPRASVRLVVRSRSGRMCATLRPGWRATGALQSSSWRATLPRGVYRLWVYAVDQAGNRQAVAGSARLTVR